MSTFPPAEPSGTKPHPYQRGDRVVLEHTTDPCTRLTPGTQGTVTGHDLRHGQLHVAWDDGSTLTMLPGEGDRVRLLTPASPRDRQSTGSGTPHHGEDDERDDGHPPQDITDPATGLSRLLAERCSTCILRPGDKMHLGPQHTARFIRQALDRGTYVICHQTSTLQPPGVASKLPARAIPTTPSRRHPSGR